MQHVHTAQTVPEAYLVADLLRREGIAVHIINEHIHSVRLEIPYDDALPQVWVCHREQATRAKGFIAEWHARAHSGERFCSHCAEVNPAHFELCWSCEMPFAASPVG